jgi:hypothetical protein
MSAMTPPELLRMLLQVPELSTVGSSQERAAFIALRIDCCTVRDAGQAIGISKSNVQNLADLFQAKLRKKVTEIRNKRESTWSAEFRQLHGELLDLLPDDYEGGVTIGDFQSGRMSREDRAEATGRPSPRFDDD